MATDIEHFKGKKGQPRRKASTTGGKAFKAMEIAMRVLRLCFPFREVKASRAYFNNAGTEPYLKAEHEGIEGCGPITKHLVIDVYFLFEGEAYDTTREEQAFVVEVTFPEDVQRGRWNVIRVRWADLGWGLRGTFHGDEPLPQIVGETFVNNWSS